MRYLGCDGRVQGGSGSGRGAENLRRSLWVSSRAHSISHVLHKRCPQRHKRFEYSIARKLDKTGRKKIRFDNYTKIK